MHCKTTMMYLKNLNRSIKLVIINFYFVPGNSLQVSQQDGIGLNGNTMNERLNSITPNFLQFFDFSNIQQLSVEIEDFLEYKDSLSRGLDLFNSKFLNDEKFKLNTETSIYTLRIPKKNGKPNMEYPSILMSNKIKNNFIEKISVVIEEKHFIAERNEKNNMTTFSKFPPLGEDFRINKKKSCCDSCIII